MRRLTDKALLALGSICFPPPTHVTACYQCGCFATVICITDLGGPWMLKLCLSPPGRVLAHIRSSVGTHGMSDMLINRTHHPEEYSQRPRTPSWLQPLVPLALDLGGSGSLGRGVHAFPCPHQPCFPPSSSTLASLFLQGSAPISPLPTRGTVPGLFDLCDSMAGILLPLPMRPDPTASYQMGPHSPLPSQHLRQSPRYLDSHN